jgi:hypothetical protein
MVMNHKCAKAAFRTGSTPSFHFRADTAGFRSLVMHALPADWPRYHLHGTCIVIPPFTNTDAMHAAPARGEERCMPAVQPLGGQRLAIVLCRVEHHFDHALDIPVGRRQRPDVDAEAAGDRGAHLVLVQELAFDFRGLEDILRQRLEHGLFLQAETQGLHASDKPPLPVADSRQRCCNRLIFPAEPGPISVFVDVHGCSPQNSRRI